jgi:hypothetical protein
MARHLSRSVVSWSLADVQQSGATRRVEACCELPDMPQIDAVAFVKCADVRPDAENGSRVDFLRGRVAGTGRCKRRGGGGGRDLSKSPAMQDGRKCWRSAGQLREGSQTRDKTSRDNWQLVGPCGGGWGGISCG